MRIEIMIDKEQKISPPAVCVVVGTNTAHCFTAPITATIRLQ